jgi:N-acetylmuramoyl-L-alanine amidase
MSLTTLFRMPGVPAERLEIRPMRALAAALVIVACAFLTGVAATSARAADVSPGSVTVSELRMAGDATRTRMLVELDKDTSIRWFLLRSPHRLVIDIPTAKFRVDEASTEPRGLVSRVQFGHLDDTTSRVIFSSEGPFAVESVDVLANENAGGFRLVADIVAASQEEFELALADQIQSTGSTTMAARSDRLGEPAAATVADRPFTIVIDPGHGGIDSGAEGVSGTQEKTITLAFALELRKALEDTGLYRVEMTRDRDVFLRLDERVRVARQNNADLFISIHADSIRLKGIKGATVYTVSDQASDAESAATALRENLSDEIAGIQIEEDKGDVTDILVDLIRRETHRFSMSFARTLVGELSNTVTLINNPHRSAGFRVLKAPDVPSVLLELGYLSNPEDEARLRDPEWRADAIASVTSAVSAFSQARGGPGG